MSEITEARKQIVAAARSRGMTVTAYLEDNWMAHQACARQEEAWWRANRPMMKEGTDYHGEAENDALGCEREWRRDASKSV